MNRRRYEHAGLGLTMLGTATALALIDYVVGWGNGTTATLIMAVVIGLYALAAGIFLNVALGVAAIAAPMWVADQVSTHRQVKAERGKQRIPAVGDPCARCYHRSETGADLFNEYGRFLFCIDKVSCAQRARAQGIAA